MKWIFMHKIFIKNINIHSCRHAENSGDKEVHVVGECLSLIISLNSLLTVLLHETPGETLTTCLFITKQDTFYITDPNRMKDNIKCQL